MMEKENGRRADDRFRYGPGEAAAMEEENRHEEKIYLSFASSANDFFGLPG